MSLINTKKLRAKITSQLVCITSHLEFILKDFRIKWASGNNFVARVKTETTRSTASSFLKIWNKMGNFQIKLTREISTLSRFVISNKLFSVLLKSKWNCWLITGLLWIMVISKAWECKYSFSFKSSIYNILTFRELFIMYVCTPSRIKYITRIPKVGENRIESLICTVWFTLLQSIQQRSYDYEGFMATFSSFFYFLHCAKTEWITGKMTPLALRHDYVCKSCTKYFAVVFEFLWELPLSCQTNTVGWTEDKTANFINYLIEQLHISIYTRTNSSMWCSVVQIK